MHTSVHKSSVPDSYMLLFIVKSYLNVSVLRYVGQCMHACKNRNEFLVRLRTLGEYS